MVSLDDAFSGALYQHGSCHLMTKSYVGLTNCHVGTFCHLLQRLGKKVK